MRLRVIQFAGGAWYLTANLLAGRNSGGGSARLKVQLDRARNRIVAIALPRCANRSQRVPYARGYVLVGPPESAKYEARIYVGEGEDPRARIDAHHGSKDFWNRLVLFTSTGEVLNKAAIRYMEARLLELAGGAGRAELDNGNAPGLPPLAEPDQQDAESFLNDMLIIYPLLG